MTTHPFSAYAGTEEEAKAVLANCNVKVFFSGEQPPRQAAAAEAAASRRVDELMALARREDPALAMPTPERVAAIVALDERLFAAWGTGLDAEQVAMLCDTDVGHIEAALDDWEARLGIQVDDIAPVFGVRAGRVPGP